MTVTIITYNEESNIERCLRSVAGLASEIIIVDSNSTDKTCRIAELFNAKIYRDSWHGFSQQKNIAIRYATREWILSLDADEELDDTLRKSIQKFILSDKKRYHGAYFSRRTFFMNRWIKHGNWSPDYVTRLLRSEHGRWSNDVVHERLIVFGKTKRLNGHLLHYPYDSIKGHMHKNLKYVELGMKHKNCSNWYIFFRSFWKFFRGYFLKLGFLDGFPGFYIASMQGFFTLYKYTSYRYISRKNDSNSK